MDKLLAGRARFVGVEQLDEVGGGRRRGDADELQIGRIARGKLAGIERGMAALAVAPHGEAVRSAGIGQVARRAHAVERGVRSPRSDKRPSFPSRSLGIRVVLCVRQLKPRLS